MARLSELVVLVTGSASRLGQATIARLVGEGATVVATEPAAADQAVAVFGERVHALTLDVTDPAAWDAVAGQVVAAHGGLHGLVNSAATVRTGPLADMEPDALRTMVEVNLLGPALGIRTLAPVLASSGGGSIVNIASTEALRGTRGAAIFSATNWGLRGLTRSAALELGSRGIRVNTVCPSTGLMHPDTAEEAPTLADDGTERAVTMGDVAAMVAFLLSDDSASCTGGDFLVDSGSAARNHAI